MSLAPFRLIHLRQNKSQCHQRRARPAACAGSARRPATCNRAPTPPGADWSWSLGAIPGPMGLRVPLWGPGLSRRASSTMALLFFASSARPTARLPAPVLLRPPGACFRPGRPGRAQGLEALGDAGDGAEALPTMLGIRCKGAGPPWPWPPAPPEALAAEAASLFSPSTRARKGLRTGLPAHRPLVELSRRPRWRPGWPGQRRRRFPRCAWRS